MAAQVLMRHARAAGICSRGARGWFQSQPGMSWQKMVNGEYTVDELRAAAGEDNPLMERVLAIAEAEAKEQADGK